MNANKILHFDPNITGVVMPEEYREMIAECAYFKAEKRGFEPGHELDDWLEAESEINTQNFYRYQT